MNLNQLYYFQTLARLEHYTKASQELYISQPTLTHAIKELENELGIPLFKKQGRNVVLSKEGKIYLNYVNQSLDCLQRGNEHMKNLQKQQKKDGSNWCHPNHHQYLFCSYFKNFKNNVS